MAFFNPIDRSLPVESTESRAPECSRNQQRYWNDASYEKWSPSRFKSKTEFECKQESPVEGKSVLGASGRDQ